MTQCRWCGQQSNHPQVCEWCRRDLTTGALVRTPPPNPHQPVSSQPTQAAPAQPAAPISSQPTQAIPTPQPLYDYSRPTTQPTAQTPADNIRFISEVVGDYTFTAKLERFFGVALPLTALNVLVLGWKPEWAIWSNLLYFFLIGAWLPNSHLVDKLDDVEMVRDLGIVVLLNILCCNHVVALVLYSLAALTLWAITRADINWSLLGVLLIYSLLRILFDLVLYLVDYSDPADMLRVGIAFLGSVPLFAMLIGWFFGGMFRADYS